MKRPGGMYVPQKLGESRRGLAKRIKAGRTRQLERDFSKVFKKVRTKKNPGKMK